MSASPSQLYAAPFDAVASRYDDSFTSSKIGRAQRSAVWNELQKTFKAGDRILEVGCGTGVDACFLAKGGIHVLACDSSSQMIEVATRRVRQEALGELVKPRLLSAESIFTLSSDGPFDGAFSNFGALNCIADLRKLALDLSAQLKPGASALLCWIGPFCFWEVSWYLLQQNRGKAFRRLNRNGVQAKLADGAFVNVCYPTVRQIKRAFAPEFQLKSIRGIGVAVPPSYMEGWAQRHARLITACEAADSMLGRIPGIRALADHLLLRMVRREKSEAA